jgi:hypothetical protein
LHVCSRGWGTSHFDQRLVARDEENCQVRRVSTEQRLAFLP